MLLACLGLFLISTPVRAGDDTIAIALDKTLPGKFGINTCDIFARALYKKLVTAGGEAHYVVYNWKTGEGYWSCHAIVVCRDAKGQYLGMDQNKRMPVLLVGSTPLEWAQWFNGPGEVQLVTTFTDSRVSGQYAQLAAGKKTPKVRSEDEKNLSSSHSAHFKSR